MIITIIKMKSCIKCKEMLANKKTLTTHCGQKKIKITESRLTLIYSTEYYLVILTQSYALMSYSLCAM